MVGETVAGTVPPVLDAVRPTTPTAPAAIAPAVTDAPATPGIPTTPVPSPANTEPNDVPTATVIDVALANMAAVGAASADDAPMSAFASLVAASTDDPTGSRIDTGDAPVLPTSTQEYAPPATAPGSSAGNGGGAVSDAARLAHGGFGAFHPWTRSLGRTGRRSTVLTGC